MTTDCTYCDSDVEGHDPLTVREGVGDGERAGVFCNYGCLQAWIDEEELVTGACCRWTPEDA